MRFFVQIAIAVAIALGGCADPRVSHLADPTHYLARSARYGDPVHDPAHYGFDPATLDVVYDYRFDVVDKVEAKYKGVNRDAVLRTLFAALTKGATTDDAKHRRVLEFVQRVFLPNDLWQPMHRDKSLVTDPVTLLRLGEGRCGHVARVGSDLFTAAGYATRLVQLGGHLVAEIFYGNSWHLFDADVFKGGIVPEIDGKIPSVATLSLQPEVLDQLPAFVRLTASGDPIAGPFAYPSYYYHSSDAFDDYGPAYYVKGTRGLDGIDFGWAWANIHIERAADIVTPSVAPKFPPYPVRWSSVTDLGSGTFRLSWEDATDLDGDLLGYRLFIATKSRGWDFAHPFGDPSMQAYIPLRWESSMYDALYRLPPSDAPPLEVTGNTADVTCAALPCFVSVMPFDSYGESVGRAYYPLSSELRLGNP